jgi:hypothetical protein
MDQSFAVFVKISRVVKNALVKQVPRVLITKLSESSDTKRLCAYI